VVRSYISLYGNGVTLRKKQIDKVLKRLAYDRPPTPLAAILASRLLVNNHRSSSFTVEKTDTTLISQSFKLLENEYGKRLTVLAFSFITFSVRGVSDIELLDLLSLDNELNASLYEYRSCSKHRVSTHIWQRLKNGAGILLRENKQGRLEWTHRKVRAYAVHKYSEQKFTKKYVHSLLGQYFASIVDKRIRSERNIAQQSITLNSIPVWFSNSHVNNRRYEEGLHHLIEANLLTEACDEVCDVDNVCAFFKCGLRNQFVRDVIKLHRAIVLTGESKRTVFSFSESFFNKVDCYMRWVRQMNGMIANFSPACGIFSTVSATQPVYSDVLKDAFALRDAEYDKTSGGTVSHYFSGKWPDISTELIQFSDTTWNRGVCFSENIQFQSIISTFCHEHPIKCVEWMDAKSDTKFVSVVNKNMLIWDTVKEEIVDSFTLYSDIYSVATNKSSTRLACGCKDRLIRIFDTQSGLLWLTIGGHSGFVTSLNFSNCGTKLCSGGTDCSIKLWNMTAAGAAITSFEGHSFEVTQVMFSPDDKRIVSG
jgi:WD40 repeat protein